MSEENEILTEEEIHEEPPFDPDEWERKRQKELEALLAPAKATRQQLNEHDEILADTLYELTLMQLGEMEV